MTLETPVTAALIVILPTDNPAVTVVDAAPFTSVVPAAGLKDAAPAGDALPVTRTPCAGCPAELRATRLSGKASVAPVAAVWLSPATPVTDAACGPGPALSPQAAITASAPTRATGLNRLNSLMVPPHSLGTTR